MNWEEVREDDVEEIKEVIHFLGMETKEIPIMEMNKWATCLIKALADLDHLKNVAPGKDQLAKARVIHATNKLYLLANSAKMIPSYLKKEEGF